MEVKATEEGFSLEKQKTKVKSPLDKTSTILVTLLPPKRHANVRTCTHTHTHTHNAKLPFASNLAWRQWIAL